MYLLKLETFVSFPWLIERGTKMIVYPRLSLYEFETTDQLSILTVSEWVLYWNYITCTYSFHCFTKSSVKKFITQNYYNSKKLLQSPLGSLNSQRLGCCRWYFNRTSPRGPFHFVIEQCIWGHRPPLWVLQWHSPLCWLCHDVPNFLPCVMRNRHCRNIRRPRPLREKPLPCCELPLMVV